VKYSIRDLVLLRDNIVKNNILNTILIATLTRLNTTEPITVGTTYLPIEKDTEDCFKKNESPSFASHLLYDVIVQNTPYRCHIGLRYAGHPIIWKVHNWEKSFKEAGKIKRAVQKILELYPIQNHSILPKSPPEFEAFLKEFQITMEIWENGNPINIETTETILINNNVQEYFEKLEQLLSDYRILNHLLIQLLKYAKHINLTLEEETLKSIPSAMNGSLLLDYRNSEGKKSELLYISELHPQYYKNRPHNIPLETINNFLQKLRKP